MGTLLNVRHIHNLPETLMKHLLYTVFTDIPWSGYSSRYLGRSLAKLSILARSGVQFHVRLVLYRYFRK